MSGENNKKKPGIVSRMFTALLIIILFGAIGFMFYASSHPDVKEKAEALMRGRDKLETAEIRDLSPSYECPVTEEEMGFGIISESDRVYTYFKDVNTDLWLPLDFGRMKLAVGKGILYNQNGVVKEIAKEGMQCWRERKEFMISEAAMKEIEPGEYYLALETWVTEGDGYWYTMFNIRVEDECTYRSSDIGVATCSGRVYFYDKSTDKEGYTFHVYNLGDNRIVEVCLMEFAPFMEKLNFNRKKLDESYYEISEDGASVTLKQEYLQSLLSGPYAYGLELGDGGEINQAQTTSCLCVLDGPYDEPYVEGPERYNVSSGEDYIFTWHLGSASSVDPDTAGLSFMKDGEREAGRVLVFENEGLREDESYVIPAEVLREGYENGFTGFWVEGDYVIMPGFPGAYGGEGFEVIFEP